MKKKLILYSYLVLLLIAVLAIFDSINGSNLAADYQKEKDELAEKLAHAEKELEVKRQSNLELEEALLPLKEELKILNSPINYREFETALQVVENYKKSTSFDEASQYIVLQGGIGSYTTGKDGSCPCGFSFQGKEVEWMENAFLDLQAFRYDQERIYFTYKAVDPAVQYTVVMTKGPGKMEAQKDWRIEEIKVED
ncbi:hypothetical protein LCM00_21655 [Bacillus infantis]|uniref:hypothetical protein n=1 Tax=Bacillus infantis TaxID=324767 RepID=UPI001CD2A722|nr:hypothetical protein [Bacillus infantis]MCA1042109.1 hypothetical protein [Bacillus infantis]